MSNGDSELKEALKALHVATIRELAERIESGDATAAEMSVAAKILKDNEINVPHLEPNRLPKALEPQTPKLPFGADEEEVKVINGHAR